MAWLVRAGERWRARCGRDSALFAAIVCWFAHAALASDPAHADGVEAAPEAQLPAALEQRLRRLARRRPGRQGVHVEDEQGRVLFSSRGDLLFNPASNAKVVTTAAALDLFGPGYRFSTELRGAKPVGGRMGGPLYLRGFGDPSLQSAQLRDLVRQLRGAGVRRIQGPIVVDGSYFRVRGDPPGYSSFRSSSPYRARPSAVTVNASVVRITITPAESGTLAKVALAPASPYLRLRGRVRTSRRRSRFEVVTYREGTLRTAVKVSGRVRVGAPTRHLWRRVFHPERFAGFALLDALRQGGVEVERPRVREGRAADDSQLLAYHLSEPLAQMVRGILKESINLKAEMLVLAMGARRFGAPGTYKKGLRAVRQYLRKVGVVSYRLDNGSGLSRRSRFRPADMVKVLRSVYGSFDFGPELLSALPVAGLEGTVARAYRSSKAAGQVRAKTGTLGGVSCLSGYVSRGGKTLFFSFMAARVRHSWRMRRRHVAMSELLLKALSQPAGGPPR